MESLIKAVFVGLFAAFVLIVLALVCGILFAIPIWLLWNWLVPVVFVTPVLVTHITLFQAWGIGVLCAFLFKGSSSSSSKS